MIWSRMQSAGPTEITVRLPTYKLIYAHFMSNSARRRHTVSGACIT